MPEGLLTVGISENVIFIPNLSQSGYSVPSMDKTTSAEASVPEGTAMLGANTNAYERMLSTLGEPFTYRTSVPELNEADVIQ